MEKQLGPEAKASLEVVDGKVVVSIKYDGAQASALASVSLSIEEYAKMLKEAIPGQIDDMVIDLLVAALKSIKI